MNIGRIQSVFLFILLSALIVMFWAKGDVEKNNPEAVIEIAQSDEVRIRTLKDPIDQAADRVTKKSFGTYVTPKNSPVQPEKFTGYHTGTDFETFADEANVDVSVYAICEGKILQKKTAAGYGGVLVQSCYINHQPLTVVYGHLNLKSIAKINGEVLLAGETIGILGQPPLETDRERKHLHLSIHKGMGIDIRGYVTTQPALTAWIDFETLK